jgi:hypothetical protein
VDWSSDWGSVIIKIKKAHYNTSPKRILPGTDAFSNSKNLSQDSFVKENCHGTAKNINSSK